MDREKNERIYCESLFGNFDKIIAELDLVHTLTQNAEKGTEAEEILRSFLAKFLPKKYQIGTGFVRGAMGYSHQCDILIYDGNNIPPVYSGYVNKIIDLRSLKAVIECKMNFKVNNLEKENEKLGSIKDMYRSDETIHPYFDEPITVLFAYKKTGKIKEKLNNLSTKNIDVVFCGEGELYYLSDSGYSNNTCENMFNGETIHGYKVTKSQHAFALLYSNLIDRLNKMKSDYSKVSMIVDYLESTNHIDYKNIQ